MKYRLKFGQYYRPVISVTLRHNNKEFKYLALIDSGADLNIFHANVASILEIDTNILQPHFFDTAVILSNDISNSGYGILGQQGFFDHFRVKMNYQNKDIELKDSN